MCAEKPQENRAEKIIEAREISVNKLFSQDFRYNIPFYQRPFSWTSTQFELLFNSINDSMNNVEGHFLGAILLQEKPNSNGIFDLVDGQQRMTALAILMAVIRDNTDDGETKRTMQDCIYQEPNRVRKLRESMRIAPWANMQEIFRKYIYAPDGTKTFLTDFKCDKIDYKDVDDPEYHIFEAIDTYTKRLPTDANQLDAFVLHMLHDVYMVHMITKSNLSSAFRLFHTMNTAGLDLSPSDILKAENLGVVKGDAIQKQYAEIWQSIEEDMGRGVLADIIAHIRAIKKPEKAKVGIYEEYQSLFGEGKLERGTKFIDYLQEIATIYKEKVLFPNIRASTEDLNRYKNIINLMETFIPFSDWVPPLLSFYYKFKSDSDLLEFVKKLEKKVVVEWASDFSETERVTSMGRIVKAIDTSNNSQDVLEKLLVPKQDDISSKVRVVDLSNDDKVKETLLSKLNDERFYFLQSGKFAKYLLLRVDLESWELENFTGYPGAVTVEHILPQHPETNGLWEKLFTEQERDIWTNKLGNLVLLSGRKNSSAQNYDFEKKKNIYFKQKSTSFRITRELEPLIDWNMANIQKRQENLANRILAIYQK